MFIEAVFNHLFWYLGPLSRSNLPLLGIVCLAIFLAVAEVGYRVGTRASRRLQDSARSSVGFAVGGMLALLGFLLGISLSMANSYYEMRRTTLLDEANALGTAWLRAQAVGGAQGAQVQRLLRQYAPLRLDVDTCRRTGQRARRRADGSAAERNVGGGERQLPEASPRPSARCSSPR